MVQTRPQRKVKTIAKSGETGLINDVTLSQGSNVTLSQVGQDIEVAATISGSAAHGSYGYIIYLDGSDACAEDWEGNLDYGGSGDAGGVDGADHEAVIQAAQDALTNGGVIFIQIPMNTEMDLTIDNDYITVTTGVNKEDSQPSGTARFGTITIDGAQHWTLHGLRMEKLSVDPTNDVVAYGTISNCEFYTNVDHAIEFIGVTNYYNIIDIIRCSFWDYGGGASPPACIYFHNDVEGNGQIHIERCNYFTRSSNAVFMAIDGRIDSVFVTGLTWMGSNSYTGTVFCRLLNSGRCNALFVHHNLFEPKNTCTFFDIDNASAQNLNFYCSFTDNMVTAGNNGETITFINNDADNGDWYTFFKCGMYVQDNFVLADDSTGAYADFVLGTTGADSGFFFTQGGWHGAVTGSLT